MAQIVFVVNSAGSCKAKRRSRSGSQLEHVHAVRHEQARGKSSLRTRSYSILELIDCQFPSINLYFSSSISVYTSEVIMVTVYLR